MFHLCRNAVAELCPRGINVSRIVAAKAWLQLPTQVTAACSSRPHPWMGLRLAAIRIRPGASAIPATSRSGIKLTETVLGLRFETLAVTAFGDDVDDEWGALELAQNEISRAGGNDACGIHARSFRSASAQGPHHLVFGSPA